MKRFLFIVVSIFFASASQAYQSKCLYNYYGGKAPVIIDRKIDNSAQELCFSDFVVVYDTARKTALWSAEKLTKETMKGAASTPRVDAFHEENLLRPEFRTTLKDYSGSGYDRGHLSPAGDQPNLKSQFESFSLSNMVPQNPSLNRGIWAQYEESVRSIVSRTDVYVITGPVFKNPVKYIGKSVPVPDETFKIVVSVTDKKAVVFVAKNDDSRINYFSSVSEIESKTGVNFLPIFGQSQKTRKDIILGLNTSK